MKKNKEENIYQKIFDQAPIGIYTINQDGVIDSFNPKMLEMSGAKSASQVIGLNVFSLDSYKKVGLDTFFRQGLNGKSFTMEVKYLSQVGKKETWRHYRGVPVFLPNSKVVDKLLLLVEDITEKKEIEEQSSNYLEELEEAKAQDEAILASIGDGLIVTDLTKRVLLVNKAAENMLGYTEQELLGKLWVAVVRPKEDNGEELPPDKLLLNKVMSSSSLIVTATIADSYNFTKKNGEMFPVAVTASKVAIEGETVGAIVVFRDITKDKEIDKAKTEFVSLASHQLRTPLSAIRWYTEMLLAGDAGTLSEKQKKYLAEVQYGNQRMVSLVNALLNVSRLELGTFVIEPELIDIDDIAKSVIDEQRPQINEKKITFAYRVAPNVPKISADPKLLRIVFQNLLSNAVKYTPCGGAIELSISLDKEKRHIAIQVVDTGYGIPENQQDKIFTKLFRADNVRDKDTDGTGLGLYIVKSIIEHSAGTIRFESEENKGTTFYITLPIEGMKKKEGTKSLD